MRIFCGHLQLCIPTVQLRGDNWLLCTHCSEFWASQPCKMVLEWRDLGLELVRAYKKDSCKLNECLLQCRNCSSEVWDTRRGVTQSIIFLGISRNALAGLSVRSSGMNSDDCLSKPLMAITCDQLSELLWWPTPIICSHYFCPSGPSGSSKDRSPSAQAGPGMFG